MDTPKALTFTLGDDDSDELCCNRGLFSCSPALWNQSIRGFPCKSIRRQCTKLIVSHTLQFPYPIGKIVFSFHRFFFFFFCFNHFILLSSKQFCSSQAGLDFSICLSSVRSNAVLSSISHNNCSFILNNLEFLHDCTSTCKKGSINLQGLGWQVVLVYVQLSRHQEYNSLGSFFFSLH